ncbi:hypothetical protein CERSUDRAFT_117450 [Gelatoporia subvermispora B]|uniref:MYND-type domain-containing protein n=1 Tax=Ceriporiopsis subvermispora (strain B) TaxID=914234 RepID=M2PDP2_CERS8|nr:hypothetical protein CERSUDRAFT_117450 [Gelatoporia subvermispora B]
MFPGPSSSKNLQPTIASQCQHCSKSQTEGVNLLKCAGCGNAVYCSKDCQRAAWPAHKGTCKSRSQSGSTHDAQTKLLFQYMHENRSALFDAASSALDLHADPERGKHYMFVVFVAPRPQPAPVEKAYTFVRAQVLPIVGTVLNSQQERDVQVNLANTTKNLRMVVPNAPAAFLVSMVCPEQGTVGGSYHVTPNVGGIRRDLLWEDMLRTELNEGILF